MDNTQIDQTNRRVVLTNAQSFSKNVFIVFLLDLFFGFLTIAIVCAMGLLVQYFSYPLVPVTLQHIKKATATLSLIYIVSIFAVSFWRHLLLIKSRNVPEVDSQRDASHETVSTIEDDKSNV